MFLFCLKKGLWFVTLLRSKSLQNGSKVRAGSTTLHGPTREYHGPPRTPLEPPAGGGPTMEETPEFRSTPPVPSILD